jgi:sugar transport system substrate-binding protein
MRRSIGCATRIAAFAALLMGPISCDRAPQGASGKPRIANIVFQDDQFFRLVLFGSRDAARDLGVDLREGNSQNKLDKERQLVDTYVTGKTDAILISPLSRTASVEAIKRAKEAGAVVIVHNTAVDGGYEDASIQLDDREMGHQTGQAAADYIRERLGGKAKVAILQFRSLVAEQSDARTTGFKSALEGLSGVEFVADQDAWLAEAAMRRAGDILTAHPDLDIIWSANEGGMVGGTLAVKNAGKGRKVAVFGIGCSDQLITFLKDPDDILQAISAPPPFDAGRKAVETALKVLRGEPFERTITMKSTCLRRSAPGEVDAYQKQLADWISHGSR